VSVVIGFVGLHDCGHAVAPPIKPHQVSQKSKWSSASVAHGLQFVLYSNRPYHEVRIPFNCDAEYIYLVGYVGGKSVPCALDTGSVFVYWPKMWQLPGRRTGKRSYLLDASEFTNTTEEVIFNSLRLGDYEMKNLPTQAVQADKKRAVDHTADYANLPLIILGDFAFYRTSVTIDYETREVIVRDATYDVSKHAQQGDEVLSLELLEGDANKTYGVPCIHGSVMGHPVRILVDCGWVGRYEMGVTDTFCQTYLSSMKPSKDTFTTIIGQTTAEALPEISWSVGDIQDTSSARILSAFGGGESIDAVIGEAFLHAYRVTIDFPHKKMLIERY
jgi:hypothetical protein